jgi:hypothetical protein
MDQVMDRLQTPANVFFMINPTGSLLGVGGIYGSPNANQNGVAIFGKYTANPTLELTAQGVGQNADYDYDRLDRKTQNRILKFFYGKKRTLRFH